MINLFRRAGVQVALLALAVLGIADAIYLTLAHYNEHVALVCSESGLVNCMRVTTSIYSYVPGTSLPITLPGLGWCLVLAGLAVAGIRLGDERRWLRVAQFGWTLLGMLTVLYLVYVEIVLLRAICVWCTVLHVLITLAFLLAVVRLPGGFSAEEEAWEEEEEEVETSAGNGGALSSAAEPRA